MAGLVPAIHVLGLHVLSKNVDARDKPGHDSVFGVELNSPRSTAWWGLTRLKPSCPRRRASSTPQH